MFTIDYRTRKGISNLAGKARIFLTCHQEDQDCYLEKSIQELLEYGNYAIWFYKYDPREDSYDYEVIREHLERAQLLVVLVTNRLLKEPGEIIGYEIAIAKEQHIPILPIVLEIIDNQLFAELFDNVHYLAPYMADETGIPYEEKLKIYLGNVLVGDRQAKMILASFRKKVFLSYRKKDRKIAESLIKMIHQQPACFDIGVWYDEFLNPGRDFENEIKQEIESCDVFALNVTPSILEEDNYVKREEVPCALENEKIILPIEMVPTDEAFLQKEYPELPICVHKEDGSAVHRIIELLGEESPETLDAKKLFGLGLAYLDGIYTEKNAEVAYQLIAAAAKQGLAEATEKLSLMYQEGQGVERNFGKALEWKKVFVQQLEEQLHSGSGTQSNADKYLDSCLFLGQDLQREGKNAEAEVYYRKMLMLSNADEHNDLRSVYLKTVCIMALADMEMEKNHLDQATDMYVDVIKCRLELVDKFGDDKTFMPVIRRALAVAYLKLGDCERVRGHYKSVLDAYEQCLNLRVAAVRQLTGGDQAEYEARRDLAVIQLRLGEVYEYISENGGDQRYASEAYYFYQESLKLRIELVEELRTDDATRDLGVIWCRLAELEMKCGMMEEAGKHLEQGLALRQQLVENGGRLQDKRNLAITYELHARYNNVMLDESTNFTERFMAIVQSYQNACDVMGEVAEQTRSISDRRGLAGLYRDLGEFYKGVGQPELATLKLYQSVEIYRGIQEDSEERIDNGDYLSVEESAYALYRLGTADNTPRHKEYLKMSYNLWSGLARLVSDNERYRQNAERIARILTEG